MTGSAVLALSVFLPWYSLAITASGAAYAQQALNNVAQQFGNPSLQSAAQNIGARFPSVAGHEIGTVSAHQILKTLSVLLLLLAAAALVGALIWLTDANAPMQVSGGQVAAVGTVAALFVLYRMVNPPGHGVAFVSLSLGWGAWLALLSSLAIVVGGLIGTRGKAARPSGNPPRTEGGGVAAGIWKDDPF